MPLFGEPKIEQLRERRDVDGLIRALDHKKDELRTDAAQALGDIGDPRAVDPLARRLSDTNENVSSAAADALRAIGGPEAQRALAKISPPRILDAGREEKTIEVAIDAVQAVRVGVAIGDRNMAGLEPSVAGSLLAQTFNLALPLMAKRLADEDRVRGLQFAMFQGTTVDRVLGELGRLLKAEHPGCDAAIRHGSLRQLLARAGHALEGDAGFALAIYHEAEGEGGEIVQGENLRIVPPGTIDAKAAEADALADLVGRDRTGPAAAAVPPEASAASAETPTSAPMATPAGPSFTVWVESQAAARRLLTDGRFLGRTLVEEGSEEALKFLSAALEADESQTLSCSWRENSTRGGFDATLVVESK